MGRRGRKPIPTALKILKGTRADRINFNEVRPPAGRPEPPATLDDTGRTEWDRLVPILEATGVLTTLDGAALGLYCAAFSRWRSAVAAVEEHGLIVATGMGGIKANPAAQIAKEAEALMLRLLGEFGGTPSARTRLAAPGEPPKDDLGEFLDRRPG